MGASLRRISLGDIYPPPLLSRSCYTKRMQQDENQDWQQPSAQAGGAPYQPTKDEVSQPDMDQSVPSGAENTAAPANSEDDSAVLRWEGPEYAEHDRDKKWYVIFALVTLALMAASIFLIQSVTFTILIPVMAAALFVYVRRAPQQISYVLSRKGIHVGDKLYTYSELKAFAINSSNGSHSLILIPRKRFQIAITSYFPEEVGEPLVDMLAARLPMQTYTPDFLDKLLAKLHI